MFLGSSGSGSFFHQAKKVSITLILSVLQLLLDFSSLKNDVKIVPSKSNKQKNFYFYFLKGIDRILVALTRLNFCFIKSGANLGATST
jgi:hypothetical protein